MADLSSGLPAGVSALLSPSLVLYNTTQTAVACNRVESGLHQSVNNNAHTRSNPHPKQPFKKLREAS